jgi:DMSO/TMAO reductase YedYZ molybdopterin-dependent catalytic subunit
MSFLDRLIKDPLYQHGDPRPASELEGADTVISPDTRRENRLPPGQTRTRKWPVLDAHGTPEVDLEAWEFEAGGLVEKRLRWSLDEFMRLPAVRVYADFHCVTRWSRLDNVWGGVSTRAVAELCGVKPEARFVSVSAHDHGWTTNLPIEYFLAEDSLFAWSHDGRPIPPEHGGPVRLVVREVGQGRRVSGRGPRGLLGGGRLSHARRPLAGPRRRAVPLAGRRARMKAEG